MTTKLEDLRILKVAEGIADGIWKVSLTWGAYARDVVGKQMARSADSVGANIAEAYGRFHYGDKLKFLYYARGSLFETKYWLNRVTARGLMPSNDVQTYAKQLSQLAHQLNIFAKSIKQQRSAHKNNAATQLRENLPIYNTQISNDELDCFLLDPIIDLFSTEEIVYLSTIEPITTESPNLLISQSLTNPNLGDTKSPNLLISQSHSSEES